MKKKTIIAAILFIGLVGILFATPVSAQTNLSSPEFTLTFSGQPFYALPTTITTVDPYTGNTTVSAISGFYSNNGSLIEITIKNQPTGSYGANVSLYYSFRAKGHFDNWASYGEYTSIFTWIDDNRGDTYGNKPSSQYIPASNSDYTEYGYATFKDDGREALPPNAQLDFLVSALLYKVSTVYVETPPDYHGNHGYYETNYTLQSVSDISDVQTITVPPPRTIAIPGKYMVDIVDNQEVFGDQGIVWVPTDANAAWPTASPMPSPTVEPTLEPSPTSQANFYSDWIPYAIIGIILVAIGAAVYLRKRKREL